MKIALLCPDASSNPLVRTYPIARVLQRRHELQVLGFRSGPEIFAPYRDAFEYETTLVRRMPAFLGQVRAMAARVRADAVYAFKPLATSLWAGLLARRRLGIPLFLDVEDWEFGAYLDGTWRDRLHHLAHLERPDGFLWTRCSRNRLHTEPTRSSSSVAAYSVVSEARAWSTEPTRPSSIRNVSRVPKR